jgi:hypothetical protein
MPYTFISKKNALATMMVLSTENVFFGVCHKTYFTEIQPIKNVYSVIGCKKK